TKAEGDDSAVPISAGKVEGNKVYFEIRAESDSGSRLFRINLERSGEGLTGTYTRETGGSKTSGKLSFTKKG
ncbi:MAG: hypothetical protein ACRD96_16720, partial [Bryobacteraceae bacterium]